MSWLSDWKKKRLTAAEVVGKSAVYLRERLGVKVTDAQATEAEREAKMLADKIEALLKPYIAKQLPLVPEGITAIGVTALFSVLDAAIAGAANTVRENN